jgi:hypothetical protein
MPQITAETSLTLARTALFQLLLIAAPALPNMTNQTAPLVPPVTAALRDVIAVPQITQKSEEFVREIVKLPASREFPITLLQLRQVAL